MAEDNEPTIGEAVAKLELVVETAREIWGWPAELIRGQSPTDLHDLDFRTD